MKEGTGNGEQGTGWGRLVLALVAAVAMATGARAATRQIPLADIAAMTEEGKKDVTVTGCVPGFYYTLRGSGGLVGVDVYGPVLCEPDKPVTFEAVEKPSETAGFFSIGASPSSTFMP